MQGPFFPKGVTGQEALAIDKLRYQFDTVAELLADTTLSYTPGHGLFVVAAGDYIEAQGFRYKVADSGATDEHVATVGGVKLYVRAGDGGEYNVAAFGAVGDATADDTGALNRIGGLAVSVLMAADAEYRITDTVTFLGNVDFNGARIIYDGPRDRSAVEFGLRGIRYSRMQHDAVRVESVSVDWTNRDFCGVVFHNIIRSRISIRSIIGFATHIRLHSTIGGVTHNNIMIERCNEFKYGLDLLCDGGLSQTNYVNENNFWGGDWSNSTSTVSLGDCYGHVFRSINNGYTGHNNNRFYGPCFQVGDGQTGDERVPVWLDECGYLNKYYRARHEGGRGYFARLNSTTGVQLSDNIFEVGYFGGAFVLEGIDEIGAARNNQYIFDKPFKNYAGNPIISVDVFGSVKAASDLTAQSIGPFHFSDSSGNILKQTTSITTRKSSIGLIGPRAVAFYVETQGGETFVMSQDSDPGKMCRLMVAVYDEKFRRIDGGAPAWVGSTQYAVGDQVTNSGNIYYCTTSGTSAALDGPASSNDGITDGTVTWDYLSEVDPFSGQEFGAAHPWITLFGGVYAQGTPNKNLAFRIARDVKYIACHAGGPGAIKSLSLRQVSGQKLVMKPFNGYEFDNRVAVVESGFHTAVGVVGKYQEGEIIPIRSVASGVASYVQCTIPGRLATAWAPSTVYTPLDIVASGGNIYVCVDGGASAGTGGPTGTGTGIVDGGVTWDFLSFAAAFIEGPLMP